MAEARFLSPLDARFLPEWDDWRQLIVLLAPLRYYSALADREIVVPAGFVCDRESRPTSGPVTGPEVNEAGVLHDYLYRSHELPRALADSVYQEALLAMGLHPVWADQRYRMVDCYGGRAYETGPSRCRIIRLT